MVSVLPTGRGRSLSRIAVVLALSAFVTLGTTVAEAPAVESFTINTPTNVVVCQPVLITWSGGEAPYSLTILPGSQPGAAPLRDLGQQDGTSYTWTADLPAGTSVGLTLKDSTGQVAQSAPFTINDGPDHSCVRP
ncbi:Ser-Thr-rich GPI-anchored membrane family protein [Streptomyces sp. NPDC001118]|uniref:Ser-Thr-rich GPI-anchored membrane family protein n=1 Tax=unclassified Streptomyces TaxID=2593676 RepID=UPI0033213508